MKRLLSHLFCVYFVFTNLVVYAQESKRKLIISDQKSILDSINHYREQHDLSPLKMDDFITQTAIQHSEEMARNLVPFGHQGFKDRMKQLASHYKYRMCAENVAYTSDDAKTVVDQWLASSGHRKNIEGNYNLTGIGMAYDKNGIVYVTQIFLHSDD